MRRLKWTYFAVEIFALVGFALVSYQVSAETFIYHNFDSTAGLILQAHARTVDGKLRLSPAIPGLGLGGAWLDAKQPVQDGFDTTFQIQITDKHSSGADGLAFVIQGGTQPALGQTGQGLGYGGITNQFVVHFDNYHWGDHPKAGKYDEIAVLAASSPTLPIYNVAANVIASASRNVVYSDGAVHTVRILYVPGNLQVFLDDLKDPLMTVYVNFAKVMNLDHGRAWVGFTAASGADWQNHDLVSWGFSSFVSPTSNEVRIWTQPEMTSQAPSPVPVYRADDTQFAPINQLLVDPSFGYRLPSGMDAAYQIETSTNLVDWTPLTNAIFYFRDPESTNYPQRFYRFQKN